MEDSVFKDLQAVSCGDEAFTRESFGQFLHSGLQSTEYSHVIHALCKQIQLFTHIQQDVNEMRSVGDANSFLMDVSSFLEELECPYRQLVSVPLEDRLTTPENRLLLLDFLIGELQAARINYVKHGPEKIFRNDEESSAISDSLKKIIVALGLSAPPAEVDAARLFARLEGKLRETLSSLPPNALGQPLLTIDLTPAQWAEVERINATMCAEYRLRREMLLKRFDVTVQSFSWSEKAKTKAAELKQVYMPRRKEMTVESHVTMADILAARDDLLLVEKTSSHSVRKYTQCDINRLVMGNVPDRGGRTSETPIPDREMPGFRPREDGGQRGGHLGRGDHGRGGGRVQHGYGRGRGRGRHGH